jgi:hypothetical protein
LGDRISDVILSLRKKGTIRDVDADSEEVTVWVADEGSIRANSGFVEYAVRDYAVDSVHSLASQYTQALKDLRRLSTEPCVTEHTQDFRHLAFRSYAVVTECGHSRNDDDLGSYYSVELSLPEDEMARGGGFVSLRLDRNSELSRLPDSLAIERRNR